MDYADRHILVGSLASFHSTFASRLIANENYEPTMSAPLRAPYTPFSPAYRLRVWLFSN